MKFLTKVVPTEEAREGSVSWRLAKETGQPYLYAKYFDVNAGQWICDNSYVGEDGDYFLESDLIPYEEAKAKESGKGMFVELST
ncbi:hypothetical protein VF02_38025, partial [Nostoc linckia z1]